MHLSAVILGLKIKLFSNIGIGFHFSLSYLNVTSILNLDSSVIKCNRQRPKCIVFMLMPLCNHCAALSMLHGMKCKGSYLKDTIPFVSIHPCEEKNSTCKNFLTLPHNK